ncbi:MAG TPA: HIT family protein [Verrucomicrobiales bacterium]|nr:HIT family protein [Verrucomicrobiales bacterium]
MDTYQNQCPFCNLESERVLNRNGLALAFRDGFPITEKHTLIIPERHVATYFELTTEERSAIHDLLDSQRLSIQSSDASVEGFNIGWNCGETAGQTVLHAHVHLIPRRAGDVENPRGGVRHLIPGKGDY